MKLNSLLVGDEAAIRTGFGYTNHRIVRVEHVTNTQIHASGRKFNRETGRMIGKTDRWDNQTLVMLTPELRDELLAIKLRSDFKHSTKWESLPLNVLQSIQSILDKHSETP